MRLRYADERDKAYRILDLTSLTVDEFEHLVPAFESAFLAHMDAWTLEGKPRTGRRYSQYATCLLPSPDDRLLFILCYLKGAPRQATHGVLFGMGQPKANQVNSRPTRRTTIARSHDGGSSSNTSSAASNAVVSSRTPFVCGKTASATWSWRSATVYTTSPAIEPLAHSRCLIEIISTGFGSQSPV